MTVIFRSAEFDGLSAATLYEILRLRVDIFVVEQNCPYPEIDGRDLGARHYWVEDDSGILAYARLLEEGDRRKIGRVVTRHDARGRGLARDLLRRILAGSEGPWVLDAQAHLEPWYGALGFTATGPQFIEDGIPHVPMRREAF